MELRLSSLGGYEPIIYQWPYLYKDQGCEIIEAISFACREEPPLRKYSEEILSGCISSSYESMKVVCQRFNQAVDHLRSLVTSGLYEVKRRASVELLHHIIQTCYNRAVVDPDKLNHYEPFSAEVYGETSFELVHQMIETIKFTEDDQFIDLGSGVGHVVLQVAASTPCKSCYGIEKAHWPALYAKQMGAEFEKWMKFYGKECGSYDLLKGNFLSDEFKDVISNATVIFVNNFAFGPQVDHELKQRFSNLKEGTKIVSSKAFCAMNMQITERNLSDIGAILTVEELSPLRGPVSWTPKRVTYYLHTIDRTQLEEYFKMRQNPLKKQRKSLTSNLLKSAGKREDGDYAKKSKSAKGWQRKSGSNYKRPPTISVVSTITCTNPHTIPRPHKRSSWNDSFISGLSTHPAYIFPSAQALTFDEKNTLQNDLNADARLNFDSPKKQYVLQSKTTPKMSHEGKTPFSTPSAKDMLLGFCSDENDLSEELQLEIENIITLFHNETSKIAHQDVYKPSAIFNDQSLLETNYIPDDPKNEKINLLSINVDLPSDFSRSLNSQIKHYNSSCNKVEESKIHPTTPQVNMPKITVTLPRFSPITPETPTNTLVNNPVKKCIPFPCLGKTNDLFVNSRVSGNVNNSNILKGFHQKNISEWLQKDRPPFDTYTTKSSLKFDKRPVITLPALHPVSCPQVMGGSTQILPQSQDFSFAHMPNTPVPDKNQRSILWDNSEAVTVSLPKQILDNSNRSADESAFSALTASGLHSAGFSNLDDGDDDSPELLHLMNVFRMQYKNFIKSMKSPCFKSRLIQDINIEKNCQESLFNRIAMLKSELLWLQEQNRILHQQSFQGRNGSINFPVIQDEFPSTVSSPGILDQAVCLDSTIVSHDRSVSMISKENFNLQQEDVIHCTQVIGVQKDVVNDNDEFSQPLSPEMPLLLPETCNNFVEEEQLNQHSKFTPPPQLTVCTDESKELSNKPTLNNQSLHPETTHIFVKKSPHHICFSPISSCGTESPVRSPQHYVSEGDIECISDARHEKLHLDFKNSNPYYSLLSSSLQDNGLPPYSNMTSKIPGVKFTCENTEPYFDVKKRKALDEVPDHLLKIKRLHLSSYLMSQMGDGSFDNMILRNVLNSKGLSVSSCVESRSDSRDSGFGKESETDSEILNRPKLPRNLSVPEIQSQKQYLARPEYDVLHFNQSQSMVASTLQASNVNLKENHCQVMAHGGVHRYSNNRQICQLIQPTSNQDNSCFSSGGHSSRPASSFELSFSSLANYYEKYLSQDTGALVHDNHNNLSNHFSLLRHTFSSALT